LPALSSLGTYTAQLARGKETEIPINDHLTKTTTSSAVDSVATVLEEQTQQTIDDWYLRLRSEELLAGSVTNKESRSSHLPDLFHELIYRLRHPVGLGSTPRASKAAAAHGLLRLKQGYSAAVLIEESRCLQVSIFNTLNANAHRIDFNHLLPDVMVIADEVDAQLAMAMASYASGGTLTSVLTVAPA
jgi:hypothetical protein